MAEPRTPDSTRRSERSRRAILDAALELVGETGYGKLTIEAIAARAGVGKQTIYRWWSSKAAVLLDASIALGAEAAREAGGAGLPDTGDLEADLKAVLRATVDELNDPKYAAPSRALAGEAAVDPQLAALFAEHVLEPQLALYAERLRSAQRTGQVAEGADLDVAVEILVGPLFHRWLLRGLPLTHAYADTVAELGVRALGGRVTG